MTASPHLQRHELATWINTGNERKLFDNNFSHESRDILSTFLEFTVEFTVFLISTSCFIGNSIPMERPIQKDLFILIILQYATAVSDTSNCWKSLLWFQVSWNSIFCFCFKVGMGTETVFLHKAGVYLSSRSLSYYHEEIGIPWRLHAAILMKLYPFGTFWQFSAFSFSLKLNGTSYAVVCRCFVLFFNYFSTLKGTIFGHISKKTQHDACLIVFLTIYLIENLSWNPA